MPGTTGDRTASLRRAVLEHRPADPTERAARRRLLQELQRLPRPFDEHADPVHVTGSAIVTDGRGRTVLHLHKRLAVWLQPGGHVEPDEDAAAAAVRETTEETGLTARHPPAGPHLLHLDVHPGPRDHLHLDVRYLLLAVQGADFSPAGGESTQVRWLSILAAMELADASLAAALRALDRTPRDQVLPDDWP